MSSEINFSHEYFVGPDHQVSGDQLLGATVGTQQTLDTLRDSGPIYDHLYDSVRGSGPVYAVVSNPNDTVSTTTAVALSTPFANRLKPIGNGEDIRDLYSEDSEVVASAESKINKISWNMLTKHYFLYEVLKSAGVSDESGATLPIIIVSAPAGDNKRDFGASGRKAMNKGDLTPLAEDVLDVVNEKGYKKIYAVGYSLGGVLVPQLVETATQNGVIVAGSVIAEPAMKTGVLKTATAFMNLGGREKSDDSRAQSEEPKVGGWTDLSPLLIRRLGSTQSSWMGNIFADIPNNWAILKGLGKPEVFMTKIEDLISEGKMPPTSFIYSRHSRLSNGIERFLSTSRQIDEFIASGNAQVIRADGHNAVDDQHGFGENHQYYVDAMTHGILFASSK